MGGEGGNDEEMEMKESGGKNRDKGREEKNWKKKKGKEKKKHCVLKKNIGKRDT